MLFLYETTSFFPIGANIQENQERNAFDYMKVLKKLLISILVMTFFAAFFMVDASALDLAYGAATVNCTDLNVRTDPSTSGSIVTTLNRGIIVVILEKTTSAWYKIDYKGTVGYVSAQFLTNVLTAENFQMSGSVTGSDINMRSSHSTSSASLGTFSNSTVMTVIGINEGWYKVKYQNLTGYIRSDYIKIVPDQKSGTQQPGTKQPDPSSSAPAPSTLGDKIVTLALKYNGYDYVYGGESPSEGFDCSGFTYYILGQLGHDISRTASQQWRNDGQAVSKSDIKPGDLLFFSCDGSGTVSHVGIYIGDSQFINAENHSAGVTICRLDSSYWSETYYGAKRIG